MGFTPNIEIAEKTTLLSIEKRVSVQPDEIDVYVEVGNTSETMSVEPGEQELDVEMFLEVDDLDLLDLTVVDQILSALCKYYPEHMKERMGPSTQANTDAIKALMARMDELGGKLNDATVELAAIRRTAQILGAPEQPQPCNK